MTSGQLTEARGWISDCVWTDLDPDDIAALTDQQITAGIRRHYDCGINGFTADTGI